jgi:hypothetical protein
LQPLKEQIDNKLLQNILQYTYHPTDYEHALFSQHVYNNPQQGTPLEAPLAAWGVVQAKDDSATGFCSALYVNETTHQAVLTFQGTKLEGIKDLLRNKSDLQEDIDGVLARAVTEQQALAYVATEEAIAYAKKKAFIYPLLDTPWEDFWLS